MTQTTTTRPPKEYQFSLAWRIFLTSTCALMFGAAIFLCVLPFTDDTLQPGAAYLLVPMGLGFGVFMLYSFLEALKGKVVLTEDSITQIEAFGRKELLTEQIKGYTADDTYIRIFPIDPNGPKLKISQYVTGSKEILKWAAFHFSNLDLITYKAEEQQLLSDQTLGLTEEEREVALDKARKVAWWLNAVGYALIAWLVFYPTPYKLAVFAAMVYPVLLALVSFRYKGIFRLNTRNNSAHPSITSGLLATGLGLGLRALFDVELLHFSLILPWVGGITLALGVLLLSATNEFNYKKVQDVGIIALIFLLLAFYGYGVSATANHVFDSAAPEVFEAQVADKHISNGKSTTYYLTLTPWGPRTAQEDVSVTQEFYEEVPVGDTIPVLLYPGALQVPYLVVE